jgi:dolichol-phosphate mannosyltransferase
VKISIIIPIYNELPRFPEVLRSVLNAPLPLNCTKEVIVVDDGSEDGTSLFVSGCAARGDAIVHHRFVNGGKGAAIRTGLKLASGDVILIQDGDLEYDPKDYVHLLTPVVNGEADVVYGSRFHGVAPTMPVSGLIANKILTIVANSLYSANITDEATGYKVFLASVLRRVHLECNRFEFCPEVTAKLRRLGYRIHEVPVSYRARGIAEGKKIRAQDGFWAIWTLLKCRFVSKKRLVCPVAALRENPQRTLSENLAGEGTFHMPR